MVVYVVATELELAILIGSTCVATLSLDGVLHTAVPSPIGSILNIVKSCQPVIRGSH
jgi:hypothetical protein